MKKKDKELLLNDLCARLPYGVKCEDEHGNVLELSSIEQLNNIDKQNTVTFKYPDNTYNTFWTIDLDKFKPYLFPMSSMSEKQIDKLKDLCDMYDPVNDNDDYEDWGTCLMTKHFMDDQFHFKFNFQLFDFLNKNRLDYRGLIPMGLVIDATGLGLY